MEIKVNCLKYNCHECCKETEMQLSEKDIRKIEAIGFSRDEFSIVIDGVRVLKNVDGSCFFLKDGKCSIYPHRPLGCRIYPVVYDVENRRAVKHDFCPHVDEISVSAVKKIERTLLRHIKEIYGFIP